MLDEIVIYNEVIDTLRAIMNIFCYYKAEFDNKKKTVKSVSPRSSKAHNDSKIKQEKREKNNSLKFPSNKFDLLEDL